MNRFSIFMLLFILVLFSTASISRATALRDVEDLVGASPDVLPALAEMEDAVAARDAAVAAGGLRAFAGAGYAVNNEPADVGSTDRIYYDRHYGRLGLSLPLLGSWARQRSAVIQAESRVLTSKQLLEAQKFSGLAALRKAYIVRWAERRRRECITAYLVQSELAESILRERMQQSLVLPADYQNFVASFAQARQLHAESLAIEERARGVMRLVTGRDMTSDEILLPDLPRLVEDSLRIEAFIRDAHPEVLALQNAAARLGDLPNVMALSELGASFDLAYAPVRDIPGTTGDSFTFGFNVEMPIGGIEAGRAASARARAVERKAWHVATLRREQLLNDLRVAMASLQTAVYTLQYAERSLVAATEATRASRLRLAALPGDMFEQHVRTRHGLLVAALDAINAAAQVMLARAEILRIATDGGAAFVEQRESIAHLPGMGLLLRQTAPEALALTLPQRLAKESIAQNESTDSVSQASTFAAPTGDRRGLSSDQVAQRLGVYMWDAAPLLDPKNRAAAFAQLKAAGITDVLFSLNSSQLHTVRGANGAPLRTIVRMAHRHGIRLSLLLGDPVWILPEARDDLVAIVTALSSVPFDGLHLDLEPDQLPQSEGQQSTLASHLADTVQVLTRVAAWPVSLSIHPRYLAADGPSPWFGKRLEEARVHEVVVMVYTTNRERVVDTIRSLAVIHPQLRLGLAQSIERNLPPDISLHSRGQSFIQKWIVEMATALDEQIHGVFLQSWEDYRTVIR
ncbi:MAG TPA: hypothetical protein DHV46_09605 [Desulfovibrio piger]|jgi:outer membrane protein TolC|uniref:TolC family protein n=1 Tax=Desulfovibrionaceae TaxID=194924 RepID=UPI000ED49211|nr:MULTISPECIES: TolC family protein [Desulfovibrionaceae]NHZ45547.1 TolC family protein [Nitratidesulfovibrio liaohensis]HCZ44767.1 hypothetical protein [Desulfovibrio piger]